VVYCSLDRVLPRIRRLRWQRRGSPPVIRLSFPSKFTLSTSVTLLERVRRRDDQAAWECFVTLYTPLFFRWAQRAGLSDDDAADLVQDVLMVLMKELPTFEYDRPAGISGAGSKPSRFANAAIDSVSE
jgi:hypothetical protein